MQRAWLLRRDQLLPLLADSTRHHGFDERKRRGQVYFEDDLRILDDDAAVDALADQLDDLAATLPAMPLLLLPLSVLSAARSTAPLPP